MPDAFLPAGGQHPPDVIVQAEPFNSGSDSEDPAAIARPVDAAREDEADEMVGVSIGITQSRIKARLTPAAEKSRIMERNEGYFQEDQALFATEITAEPESLPGDKQPSPAVSEQPLPPARVGQQVSKESGRSSFTRSILKSGLPLRPRAWSGDHGSLSSLKKFLPDLGSLTKRPSLHLRHSTSSQSQRRSRSLTWKSTSSRLNLDQEATPSSSRSPRPSTSSPNSSASNTALTDAEDLGDLKPLEPPSANNPAKHSFSRRPSTTPSINGLALRRLSSDQSLYLRASSTASSLEHRPQYENIHSQSNSRFKAIKDTLQDSSSRLLSRPTLHLQDLKSEWGYRPFLADVTRRERQSSTADEPLPSRSTSPPPPSPQDRVRRDLPSPSLPRTQSPKTTKTNSNVAASYPVLFEAMSELTGDVVVMGGYRGSILRSAKPPQRQLWVPMKVGLNLRKVDLEVGLTHEDEERMEETIIPSGVLSHIGPVDICRRLLKRLQKCDNAVRGDLRVWDYGYDWRLSPHLLSQRLIRYLEGLPCNAADVPQNKRGAYVIAHSLGGLITRHAVNQRPDLFAGVVYAGVPQHCVNILGPLRNGDDVLLSSRVLTAQVNFTFRTSFALLPEDGHCFIDKRTKEEYRVDFFNPSAWDEYHLSPCINPPLPSGNFWGLKDNFPLITKRFSAVLSGKDFQMDETPDFPGRSSGGLTEEDKSGRHTPTGSVSLPANSVLTPTGEGVVGPSNMRGSSSTIGTTQPSTIPRDAATAYLTRTLAEVLRFKQELAFKPAHQSLNSYPPFSVLYSKSLPTVYGARVSSREQIKHNDAYDDLAFAAGDGVCLASAAMLPPGYRIIKDGLVKSERGHVGLLGDLEGVGHCLRAVIRGRREAVGVGVIAASD